MENSDVGKKYLFQVREDLGEKWTCVLDLVITNFISWTIVVVSSVRYKQNTSKNINVIKLVSLENLVLQIVYKPVLNLIYNCITEKVKYVTFFELLNKIIDHDTAWIFNSIDIYLIGQESSSISIYFCWKSKKF